MVTLNLDSIGGSALTDLSIAVPEEETQGIPVTYVPARNTVFLSIALGWAEVLGARDIFIGVNAVDYSGYPDCRPEYIAAFEAMANLATRAGVEGRKITIHTPLMKLGKGEIIRAGHGPGRGLFPHGFLLPGDGRGPGLWQVRQLPPAPPGFCGCRVGGPHTLRPIARRAMIWRSKKRLSFYPFSVLYPPPSGAVSSVGRAVGF